MDSFSPQEILRFYTSTQVPGEKNIQNHVNFLLGTKLNEYSLPYITFFFSFYTLFIDNLLMLELLQLKKFQDLLIHVLKLIRNSTLSSTHCQNYLQKLH